MMGEDGVRFAQKSGLLRSHFMCSAWMKPVFAHTMGQGHKTLDASSFLANPSAWRSLSVKVCIFHQFRVSLVYASRWMTKEVQLSANDKVHRCHHVRSPGVTCCSPWPWFPAGVKSVQARHRASAPLSAMHLTARPCKSSLVADQRPRELHPESHLIHTGCEIKSIMSGISTPRELSSAAVLSFSSRPRLLWLLWSWQRCGITLEAQTVLRNEK